jgi:hypothetical protein
MGAGHLGGHPAFIRKDQAFHRKLAHLLAVSLALGSNLGPLLLGRPKGVFLDAA